MRFKNEGYDVNPHDEGHIQAYVQLRVLKGRVNGQSFASFLASKKDKIQLGGSSAVQYYGVPKTIFPGGLPEDLRFAEVPSEELVSLAKAMGSTISIDYNHYYVLDMVAQRHLLGRGVVVLNYETKSVTSCKSLPAAAQVSDNSVPVVWCQPPAAPRTHASRSLSSFAASQPGAAVDIPRRDVYEHQRQGRRSAKISGAG